MNAIFKACLLSLLLLIALSSVAYADNLPAPLISSQDPKFSFLTTRSGDDFALTYDPGTATDISGMLTQVKDAQADTDWIFGSYQHYTTIVVAGSNSEFRLFINVGNAPDTAKALNWNVGYNGLIVTKSPSMLSDFKQVLAHQIARIAVRTRETFYKSLPEWYQDGVASFAAGDLTPGQRANVTTSAVTGKWQSLDDIERAYANMTIYNYDEQEYRDARAHAAVLVDDIGTRFGNKVLVGIIDDYTNTGNLTLAFVNQTTFTPGALNDALRMTLSGGATPTPGPTAGGTVTAKPGNSASPTASPTVSPTAVQAGLDGQNVTGATTTAGDSWSLPPVGDLAIPALFVALNAIAVAVLFIILRRNWH